MRKISSVAVITDAANIDKELTGFKISHAVALMCPSAQGALVLCRVCGPWASLSV